MHFTHPFNDPLSAIIAILKGEIERLVKIGKEIAAKRVQEKLSKIFECLLLQEIASFFASRNILLAMLPILKEVDKNAYLRVLKFAIIFPLSLVNSRGSYSLCIAQPYDRLPEAELLFSRKYKEKLVEQDKCLKDYRSFCESRKEIKSLKLSIRLKNANQNYLKVEKDCSDYEDYKRKHKVFRPKNVEIAFRIKTIFEKIEAIIENDPYLEGKH